jgi:hypothetical protein
MFYFHGYIHDDDVMFCGPIFFVTNDNNNLIGFNLNYNFSCLGRIPHLFHTLCSQCNFITSQFVTNDTFLVYSFLVIIVWVVAFLVYDLLFINVLVISWLLFISWDVFSCFYLPCTSCGWVPIPSFLFTGFFLFEQKMANTLLKNMFANKIGHVVWRYGANLYLLPFCHTNKLC